MILSHARRSIAIAVALTGAVAVSAAAVSAAPSHGAKGAGARQQAFNARAKQ